MPLKGAKKYEGMTPDQKRALVISDGKRVEYFVCPMCMFNRPYRKYSEGRVNLTDIPVNDLFVLQVRSGGGRGSGFFRIDGESLRLEDMKGDPKYNSFLQQIKARC